MIRIVAKSLVCLAIVGASISCSQGQGTKIKNSIVDKISALNEFKKEDRRIDSLSSTGMKVEIAITIVGDYFNAKDSLKNIATAFISEQTPFDEIILYEIKFDKKTEEILSVKSNKQ